jgi:hypothetical protein
MMHSEDFMLRRTLLFSTLLSVPAFAQSPEIQARLAAQQNLLRELRVGLARYTPQSPRVSQLQAFIGVLEEQSRLLQRPRERWAPDAVDQQVQAITQQLSTLRRELSNHRPGHPGMSHDRAIIDLLEVELRDLQIQ